jgi:hypothetical protein
VPRKLVLFLISLENDQSEKMSKYANPKTNPNQSYPSKNINSIGVEPINRGQIDSPGWGGCLALASALCAGLMIGPQRRKPPAVSRDFGPGCIRATHFGKNDSPQFSSLRDLS